MKYPIYGLAFILIYSAAGWLLADRPLALSLFGNATLILTAALVPAVVARRRREWGGCQRLFFDLFAISMILWIVGHLGWAYDDIRYGEQTWLKWHTLFSLCAGFGPLVALLARPHRGRRNEVVAPVAMTMATYGLLAVFVYSYFVLVPSVIPVARPAAQQRLLFFVQANRLLLLVSLTSLIWFARDTPWKPTYVRLAVGVAIGFLLRLGTSQAIARGDYQAGTLYDLAWIAPWLFYAWAAASAPPSPARDDEIDRRHEVTPVSLLAVPALLVPLVGYGVLNLEAVGEPVDSFRLFLTSLTTVAVLGLVTVRLAMQGSELQRTDARLQLLAAATEHTGDLILIAKPDGTFEHANGAFLRAFGYTRAELASRRFADLIEPGMDRIERRITAEVNTNGVWRGTLRGLRKDGSTFPAACTIT
ncbi:MAG TPA: PAS domain-containing protein, partial [Vicinamibacterales bacterium]|nr:PAS domain-containing protein [Vicinamibacterales bacterium]